MIVNPCHVQEATLFSKGLTTEPVFASGESRGKTSLIIKHPWSSSRTAVQPEGQERYLRMIKKTERRVEASIKELQIINQPNRKNMYHTKPHSQIEAISCHILTSHDIPKAFLTPRPLMISWSPRRGLAAHHIWWSFMWCNDVQDAS
jgi:hypothetical protein